MFLHAIIIHSKYEQTAHDRNESQMMAASRSKPHHVWDSGTSFEYLFQ